MWDTAWKDGTMKLLTDLFRKTDYRPAGFIGMSIGGRQEVWIAVKKSEKSCNENQSFRSCRHFLRYSTGVSPWTALNAAENLL